MSARARHTYWLLLLLLPVACTVGYSQMSCRAEPQDAAAHEAPDVAPPDDPEPDPVGALRERQDRTAREMEALTEEMRRARGER